MVARSKSRNARDGKKDEIVQNRNPILTYAGGGKRKNRGGNERMIKRCCSLTDARKVFLPTSR